jgi:hypothetical protein
MAEIVNLRLARKRKAREESERAAEQNRLLHGRTKAEKTRDRDESEKTASFLDGHRREPPSPGDKTP